MSHEATVGSERHVTPWILTGRLMQVIPKHPRQVNNLKSGFDPARTKIFFLAQLYMSADMRETPTQTYVLPILKGVINGMAVTLEISFEVFQKPDRNFL